MIPKVSMGLRSVRCKPVKFFHCKLAHLLWTSLCGRCPAMLEQEGAIAKLFPKLGEWNCPKCSFGQFLKSELLKNNPTPPNFTLNTLHSEKYCSPANCKNQTHPSYCQTEKPDSSLQRTRLHCAGVQWWRALFAASDTLHIALLGLH